MNTIYLDNSATTRTYDEVTEYMSNIMRDVYGNPSSMHMAGVAAERAVRQAQELIALQMKVTPNEICFTSGGTESDNLALIGTAIANGRAGRHLITTKTEHPAVLETMKYLEEQGFSVTYLDVDTDGRVSTQALSDALTPETILVSVMHVNNEIGSLNDIGELAGVTKKYNPSIIFHTDAVQSFGKFAIYPKRAGIDLVSVSGHKIHGPKGAGFLYIGDNVKIKPIIYGGGQQRGMRSGTENVPGICGLGLAAKLVYEDLGTKVEKLYELKEYFIRELQKLPDVRINGIKAGEDLTAAVRMSAPHIVSAAFLNVRAEVLLHALEAKGIYVSAGSACASNKPAVSKTLQAIGLEAKLIDSVLRFSFSYETKREELDHTIAALAEELPKLRKYMRH